MGDIIFTVVVAIAMAMAINIVVTARAKITITHPDKIAIATLIFNDNTLRM